MEMIQPFSGVRKAGCQPDYHLKEESVLTIVFTVDTFSPCLEVNSFFSEPAAKSFSPKSSWRKVS